MSRVQLALNVADIDAGGRVLFQAFGTPPAKVHPGYANFAIADPPLKLERMIENPDGRSDGVAGALNHLGVEVESAEEVRQASERLSAEGLSPAVEESTTCCYALQDKAWVEDPDGTPWEVYTVLADAPEAVGMGCATESCASIGCC